MVNQVSLLSEAPVAFNSVTNMAPPSKGSTSTSLIILNGAITDVTTPQPALDDNINTSTEPIDFRIVIVLLLAFALMTNDRVLALALLLLTLFDFFSKDAPQQITSVPTVASLISNDKRDTKPTLIHACIQALAATFALLIVFPLALPFVADPVAVIVWGLLYFGGVLEQSMPLIEKWSFNEAKNIVPANSLTVRPDDHPTSDFSSMESEADVTPVFSIVDDGEDNGAQLEPSTITLVVDSSLTTEPPETNSTQPALEVVDKDATSCASYHTTNETEGVHSLQTYADGLETFITDSSIILPPHWSQDGEVDYDTEYYFHKPDKDSDADETDYDAFLAHHVPAKCYDEGESEGNTSWISSHGSRTSLSGNNASPDSSNHDTSTDEEVGVVSSPILITETPTAETCLHIATVFDLEMSTKDNINEEENIILSDVEMIPYTALSNKYDCSITENMVDRSLENLKCQNEVTTANDSRPISSPCRTSIHGSHDDIHIAYSGQDTTDKYFPPSFEVEGFENIHTTVPAFEVEDKDVKKIFDVYILDYKLRGWYRTPEQLKGIFGPAYETFKNHMATYDPEHPGNEDLMLNRMFDDVLGNASESTGNTEDDLYEKEVVDTIAVHQEVSTMMDVAERWLVLDHDMDLGPFDHKEVQLTQTIPQLKKIFGAHYYHFSRGMVERLESLTNPKHVQVFVNQAIEAHSGYMARNILSEAQYSRPSLSVTDCSAPVAPMSREKSDSLQAPEPEVDMPEVDLIPKKLSVLDQVRVSEDDKISYTTEAPLAPPVQRLSTVVSLSPQQHLRFNVADDDVFTSVSNSPAEEALFELPEFVTKPVVRLPIQPHVHHYFRNAQETTLPASLPVNVQTVEHVDLFPKSPAQVSCPPFATSDCFDRSAMNAQSTSESRNLLALIHGRGCENRTPDLVHCSSGEDSDGTDDICMARKPAQWASAPDSDIALKILLATIQGRAFNNETPAQDCAYNASDSVKRWATAPDSTLESQHLLGTVQGRGPTIYTYTPTLAYSPWHTGTIAAIDTNRQKDLATELHSARLLSLIQGSGSMITLAPSAVPKPCTFAPLSNEEQARDGSVEVKQLLGIGSVPVANITSTGQEQVSTAVVEPGRASGEVGKEQQQCPDSDKPKKRRCRKRAKGKNAGRSILKNDYGSETGNDKCAS